MPTQTAVAEQRCPQCFAHLARKAKVCMRCGFNKTTRRGGRKRVQTSSRKRHAHAEAKEGLIPATMFGIGFTVWLGATMAEGGGLGAALLANTIGLAVWPPLAIGAGFAAAWVLKCSFGNLGPAVLKMAAIGTFPAALATLAGLIGGGPLFFVVLLFSYFGLLTYLFDLSVFEAIVYTVILWVIERFAAMAVLAAILG